MRSLACFALLLMSLAPPSARAAPPPTPATGLTLERVASGLADPLYIIAPPGDPRLFVVEQSGRIRIVKAGRLLPTPFLDLRDRVRSGGEQGLLSVAFHPRYAANGFLYVNYTDRRGDTQVMRYTVSRDPDRADPSSAKLVLMIEQPFSNHNGGLVMFGPDSMLYVGMGDGGSGGDPYGHGQNRATLLGKMLRLDVDRGDPYAVPRDNPFVGRPGMRGEIWAYGLRNPWRFWIDSETGSMFVADAGRERREEVDLLPRGKSGVNFGWPCFEGSLEFDLTATCDGAVPPLLDYPREGDACAVIGGVVARDRRIPALAGRYLYGDFCAGKITAITVDNGRIATSGDLGLVVPELASFGVDGSGRTYVMSLRGEVFRIDPKE